jgi:hypothetical protein
MVQIYNAPHLAYQHMLFKSEIARTYLPKLKIKDLPAAILRLQKEVNDYVRLRDELSEITYDGIITQEERPRYDAILKELDDIYEAITEVRFARQTEDRL